MKKNYFLAMLAAFAMVSMTAQFTDDMESYTDGSPISGGHWTDWGCGGGAGCALMASSNFAHAGTLSGMVPGDGTTDAVLDCGNKIFGTWGLEFYMYVPSDKEGYFNIQGQVPIGSGEWIVGNIYFNKDNADAGHGFVDLSSTATEDDILFDFPHDEWFQVVVNVDISTGISSSTWQFGINGVDATGGFVPFTDGAGTYPSAYGGYDFFSITADVTEFYMDDFTYQDSFINIGLGLEDIQAKGFAAYPNPVNDVLNLRADENMTQVSIHNLLGQEVYNASLDATQTTVDMSQLAKGAYFVKVNIGDTEGTIKVIK